MREAIDRDAKFLESNDVMDYSMLVGLSNSRKLLVLGIIGKTKKQVKNKPKPNK